MCVPDKGVSKVSHDGVPEGTVRFAHLLVSQWPMFSVEALEDILMMIRPKEWYGRSHRWIICEDELMSYMRVYNMWWNASNGFEEDC